MVAKSRSSRPEVFCSRTPLVAASESPLSHVLLFAIIKLQSVIALPVSGQTNYY